MGQKPAERQARQALNADRIARGLPPVGKRRKPRPATVRPEDYETYIQSSAWRAVRQRFIDSKLPKICMGCTRPWGSGDHLHHRTYRSLGNEILADLVPLCQACHQLVHDLHRANQADPDARSTKLWYATNQVINKVRSQIGRQYQQTGRLDVEKLRPSQRVQQNLQQRAAAIKTGAAGGAARKAGRSPVSSSRTTSAVPKPRVPGVVPARRAGSCPFCAQPYPAATPIAKVGTGWGHDYCATESSRRAEILSGDTYASRKPSTWRRGAGPASTPTTR
jgi:5-methylcytosine-specific restriction endonuclease McrA